MFELTINDQVYAFNFGMGFLREVNKKISTDVENLKGVKKNIGLRYMIADVIDGNPEALVEILNAANKGQTPRVTAALLDAYIDDQNTDIDALFESVIDFLKSANATRKTTIELLEMVEAEKEKARAAK